MNDLFFLPSIYYDDPNIKYPCLDSHWTPWPAFGRQSFFDSSLLGLIAPNRSPVT